MRKLINIQKEYNNKWGKVLNSLNKTKYDPENQVDYLKDLTKTIINPFKLNNKQIVFKNCILKADIDVKQFFFISYFSNLIYNLTKKYNSVIELGSGFGLRSLVGSKKTRFYCCELNEKGRLVQKKLSKKLKKKTSTVFFDFNKIQSLNKFKKLQNKCLMSFTFFEQISNIDEKRFKFLSEVFKKTNFIFFEPVIFKKDKNIISNYNRKYCKKNKYNNNLIILLKKYAKNIEVEKNLFCFSYSPNNLNIGSNVISLIKGTFK